jgi:hypothetical protein
MNKVKNNSLQRFDLSSCALHIIAMASMLIDHALKTVVENDSWALVLGRLAFPIFAFMVAEGYFHTCNFRRYVARMTVFAVISEIPYNLMKSGRVSDIYDQNVMWTFLLALLTMKAIDLARSKGKVWLSVIGIAAGCFASCLLGMVLMVDYGGFGVLTVLVFYFYRERTWWCRILQLLLMFLINVVFLGAMGYSLTATVFGRFLEFPLQGFALLALIPIWLYKGRQGYHSKPFKYLCYAFYPVHMLVLALLSL